MYHRIPSLMEPFLRRVSALSFCVYGVVFVRSRRWVREDSDGFSGGECVRAVSHGEEIAFRFVHASYFRSGYGDGVGLFDPIVFWNGGYGRCMKIVINNFYRKIAYRIKCNAKTTYVIGMYVGVATAGVFIIWYTHSSFMGIDLSQDGHSLVRYSQLSHWGQCSSWERLQSLSFHSWLSDILVRHKPVRVFPSGEDQSIHTLPLGVGSHRNVQLHERTLRRH
ncbi:unnamed protein product [Brassica rapa]|uniref:Uncharacterized protein n=1 Tax=Brassica campestris TaxID=3711 RepID=A0A3P5YZ44_BRACM|nr:unnamed protein product [Brassica rapa]VDC65148.1 unnamed protein product [Brassica rapa]